VKLPSYQDLSKEQDAVLNLDVDGDYVVAGPPGTGKTVIALRRAELMNNLGKPVTLLMYSRLLSQYTDAAVRELGLASIVEPYYAWFWHFYRRHYKRKPPQLAPFTFDWSEILETVAVDPPPADSLDYLIIDEGQDFPREFYMVAAHIARNLTVFADENQRLCDQNSTLHEITTVLGNGAPTATLTRNYRNTFEIAALASTFHTGIKTGIAKPPARRGDRPVIRGFSDLRRTVDFIAQYERNNSDLEIGVLVPFTRQRVQFFNRLKGKTKNPVQTFEGGLGADAPDLDFDTPGIKVITYASAKGLEFDTVFMPELQVHDGDLSSPVLRMRLYVMLSRARDNLFLLYSGARPRALGLFDKRLVEIQ
jgi:superfamily I DNA/RNA helicase